MRFYRAHFDEEAFFEQWWAKTDLLSPKKNPAESTHNQGDDDYADDASTQGVIIPGVNFSGVLERELDADWFRIELSAGTVVEIDQLNYREVGLVLINIYDDDGNLVIDGRTTSLGLATVLTTDVDATFFAEIIVANVRNNPDWQPLFYEMSSVTYIDDHGNKFQTATSISIDGDAIQGTISTISDRDYFSVELIAGEAFRIDIRTSEFEDRNDRIGFSIFDETGALHYTYDPNATAGNYIDPQVLATVTGTHYIRLISPNPSSLADYTIQLSSIVDDRPPDSVERLIEGQSVIGEMQFAGDFDVFEFSGEAGDIFSFDFVSSVFGQEGGALQTSPHFITFRDASGNRVSALGWAGDNEIDIFVTEFSTYFVLPETGTFTIELGDPTPNFSVWGYEYGPYEFTMTSIDRFDISGAFAPIFQNPQLALAPVPDLGPLPGPNNIENTIVVSDEYILASSELIVATTFRDDVISADNGSTVRIDGDIWAINHILGGGIVDGRAELIQNNGNIVLGHGINYVTAFSAYGGAFENSGSIQTVSSGGISVAADINLARSSEGLYDQGYVINSGSISVWANGLEFSANGTGQGIGLRISPELFGLNWDLSFPIFENSGSILVDAYFSAHGVEIYVPGLIENSGSIVATDQNVYEDSIGIIVSSGLAFELRNSGRIEADKAIYYVHGELDSASWSDNFVSVTNIGEIIGDIVLEQSLDTFLNSGEINGDIHLGGLDDTYDASEGGTVSGLVNFGDGNDQGIGGSESDRFFGGNGNDSLNGGGGDDLLSGGSGNDLLDGGEGFDIVTYEESQGRVRIDLNDTQAQNTLSAGQDTLISIEAVVGSAFDDVLRGNSENNTLVGLLGNDQIRGLAGDDTLSGDAGNDSIFGGTGADQISGGLGNDRIFAELGNDTVDAGDGDDVALGQEGDDMLSGGAGRDLIWGGADNDMINGDAGDDILRGNDGDDTLNGGLGADNIQGGAGINTLNGGEGNDKLIGVGSHDILNGGDGDDFLLSGDGTSTMSGGAGRDFMIGGAGADTMDGGIGNDSLFGNEGDDIMTGGEGFNRLFGGDGEDDLTGGSFIDWLFGGTGNDILRGGGQADELYGEGGDDQMFGEDGNDLIRGNDGADTLDGGAGNDNINGNAGADTLIGGAGADILFGGSGIDTFVFNAGDALTGAVDRILDLEAGELIQLGAHNFLGEGAFTGGGSFEVRYSSDGTNTRLELDRDGNGAADELIIISGDFDFTSDGTELTAAAAGAESDDGMWG